LAQSLGYGYHYDSAEEVFEELAHHVVEFQDLSYEKIGKSGVKATDVPKVSVES
jgi:predicted molibdopterin-dependent oxidoreductase YjgC